MKDQDETVKTTESKYGEAASLEAGEAMDHRTNEPSQADEYSFRALYENTPVMMHSLGASNQLVCVNRRWLEVLGYEEREVIGHKSSEFLTEASLQHIVEVARPELRKTGFVRDVPYPLVKKSGDVIDFLLSAVAERDATGQFIRSYSYLLDVNEHRTSDELWRQLLLVEERNRMSRDLHETVERTLIDIMLLAGQIGQLMDSDPSMARAELESTHALAKAGLEQARRAVWDLEPLAITSRHLREVISRVLGRLADEGIRTYLTVDEEGHHKMDERNKLAIIRIVQEALSNVRLHSRATMVKVRLSYTRSQVVLTITDDGVGFDPSTTHGSISPASRGFGLANMRESARLAGGSIDVISAPGSGADIEVRIPFEHYSGLGIDRTGRPLDKELAALTNRELEALKILADGGRNKDVAAAMLVSLRTVKFHIENMYRKLDVRTRAELIRVATQRGLLTV